MKTLKFYNRVLGWGVFVIAAIVYLLTIESTASLWDCGEFIASSNKLQVMHSPGAPVFMIIARFFTLFAINDVTKIALMVNAFSALASAFTILFLFWTITHLAIKLVKPGDEPKTWQMVAILGSSLVGALAYTFSDTFWFSAVEGEVYASSSLFTAVVFWAILKWENEADEKYANRWLIFIAYMMGLSIGVHLLNLLAIPAIGMVYYFKKYTYTRKGIFWALAISTAILGAVMLIIPGVVWLAGMFELMFVNGFGLPFNTGVLFFVALIIAGIIYGIWLTHKKSMPLLNTILLTLAVILIGYSSFAMTVIRSRANPPLDMNNPENVFTLLSYLNREQYGDYPKLKGPYFNSRPTGRDTLRAKYSQVEGKYLATDYKTEATYKSEDLTLFPRMWSSQTGQPNHVAGYVKWADLNMDDLYYSITGKDGKKQYVYSAPKDFKISFGDNLKYFFRYQIGHMYFRYFMWNFAGRQNDEQGDGGPLRGNWISGLNTVDNAHIGGDMTKLPQAQKDHPSRNTYYLLPLLLGLLGIYFQASKHKKDFSVVAMLFFMTGIAIVIYLNQPPFQPRERDYAYAGSFYAFAIWIGLGVLGLINIIGEKGKNLPVASAIAGACLILVPANMAKENWDDHDRSGRYMTRETARNYLNSCAPNAILFTHGDNDTYPLWYAQQVEGIRTDIRVVNTALLYDDDYIDQMRQKAFKSDTLPISIPSDLYMGDRKAITIVLDTNDFIIPREGEVTRPFLDTTTSARARQLKWILFNINPQLASEGKYVKYEDFTPLKELIDNWVSKPNKDRKWDYFGEGHPYDILPTQKFIIPVNPADVTTDIVPEEDRNLMVDRVEGTLTMRQMTRQNLIILDILASNNWKRPVYFVNPGYLSEFGLEDYVRQEGLAYQFVPISTVNDTVSNIATNVMYDNVMNKFTFKNSNDPDVYLDVFHRNNLRVLGAPFYYLAMDLIYKGELEKAEKVLDKGIAVTGPFRIIMEYDLQMMMTLAYLRVNPEKAMKYGDMTVKMINDDLKYFSTMESPQKTLRAEYSDILRSLSNLYMEFMRHDGRMGITQETSTQGLLHKLFLPYPESKNLIEEYLDQFLYREPARNSDSPENEQTQ
ncbi:MAG: DUF2723 domain-containing protein [Bacteroidales bacterium]|nr:DUF2723 domain-containing protein [Bacteroidales bacterium]